MMPVTVDCESGCTWNNQHRREPYAQELGG